MTLLSLSSSRIGVAILGITLLGVTSTLHAQSSPAPSPIAFAIHGGAGAILRQDMTPQRESAYVASLTHAVTSGYAVLQRGGTSLDAVETAIRLLEDDSLFNAGKGAVFTATGTIELDAAIMDGRTLGAGSVAGLQHIKNPITLARRVMEHSPHVMMIGRGAEQFALAQGMDTVSQQYFWTERRWKDYERTRDSILGKSPRSNASLPEKKYGTVGAVALDRAGNLAAGTSTGGTAYKLYGRVGDSPIIGAGVFADNASCAVSSTGTGEFFIRNTVAVDICKRVEYLHESVAQAADAVVMRKLVAQHGDGGVIALDRRGNIATPFNTPGMYRAFVGVDGIVHVAIYK